MEEKRKAKKSSNSSFFKSSFSSKEPTDPNSVEGITNRIKSLEGRIKEIEEQTGKLQEERNSFTKASESKKEEGQSGIEEERLESLKLQLGELEAKKAERLQLAEKRAEITGAISAIISNLDGQEAKKE